MAENLADSLAQCRHIMTEETTGSGGLPLTGPPPAARSRRGGGLDRRGSRRGSKWHGYRRISRRSSRQNSRLSGRSGANRPRQNMTDSGVEASYRESRSRILLHRESVPDRCQGHNTGGDLPPPRRGARRPLPPLGGRRRISVPTVPPPPQMSRRRTRLVSSEPHLGTAKAGVRSSGAQRRRRS